MATGKNEKATDLMVVQKLKDAGIKFCPNGSSIADIKKALKSASKRGNGRNGYPEYVREMMRERLEKYLAYRSIVTQAV